MGKIQLLSDSYNLKNKRRQVEVESVPLKERHLLYNIFMQAPVMFCILKGPHHIVELINEPFRKMINEPDPIGEPFIEIIPGKLVQLFSKILSTVYNTGTTHKEKEILLSIDNGKGKSKVAFFNFDFKPFLDEDGRTDGILIVAYDVTELIITQTKIKESEKKYQKLIYGLPCAFYTCNAQGYIQMYNEAAVQLWGRKPVIGKDLWCGSWEIFANDGITPLPLDECPMAIALKEGRVVNREILIKRPDGTTRNIVPHPQPFYDYHGKITGAVNTLIDITTQVSARKQLEQNAEMIQNLYMNAPAFVCILRGHEMVYELVNPEYQKLFGTKPLLGLKLIEAHPELKETLIIDLLDKVYNTGKPYVGTEQLLYVAREEGKEPEATYLNFSFQPIYNIDKEINGILVFGYEVTEQVLSKKKNEQNLKQILEFLPQITSASSALGTNIYFNKFFFDYSGLSKDEAAKNGWNAILHPQEIENVLAKWEHCKRNGEDFYSEIRLKRKSDNMYRWHIAHITAIRDYNGRITQWVASAADIHEQKIKEKKKDEFISIASHEMKTPLTTAKAYIQLLENSIEKSDEKAHHYAKKAIHSLNRLMDLIAELLDVSKIQHGELNFNFDLIDFNDTIDEAIEGIQHSSSSHLIIKSGNIPVPYKGDKERLQQVIFNLLINAVKYSPNADKVYVNTVLENGAIRVSVKDNGIGIAKEHLEKIFDRFYRVDGQNIQFQGLGIGLYISMEIIRRHGGRIWAESTLGEGTTFHFTLPLLFEK